MTETLPPVRSKESIWDRIVLGGYEILGCKIRVTGYVGRKIDVQGAEGEDGGTMADKGIEPSKPQIIIDVFEGDAPYVNEVLDLLDPDRDGYVATPVPVVYPSLNARRVREIVIQRVYLPEPLDNGMIRFRIDVLKFYESAKKKTASAVSGRSLSQEEAIDQSQQILRDAIEAGNLIGRQYGSNNGGAAGAGAANPATRDNVNDGASSWTG